MLHTKDQCRVHRGEDRQRCEQDGGEAAGNGLFGPIDEGVLKAEEDRSLDEYMGRIQPRPRPWFATQEADADEDRTGRCHPQRGGGERRNALQPEPDGKPRAAPDPRDEREEQDGL